MSEEGVPAIDALAPAWRELVERTQGLAFADALWTRCYWSAFGDPRSALMIHALYRGERLAAVLPLTRTRRPLASWRSLFNAHTPVCSCAVDLAIPGVAGEILDHLLRDASLLDLQRIAGSDPLCTALQEAARERRLPIAAEPGADEALIDCSSPWASFCRTLPESVRRHLQKQRQLERQGQLEFEELSGTAGLDPLLDECFALEAGSWKGTEGSPIRSRPDTLAFYTELARGAARSGRLALYTLRLDGRLIAFELGLKDAQRVDALKISYAADLAAHSPGNVLRTLALRSEIEKGDVRIHHLGLSSPWKRRWATRQLPLYRLRIYGGGLLARTAHLAGPCLRQRLARSRHLRAALHAGHRFAARALAAVTALAQLRGGGNDAG